RRLQQLGLLLDTLPAATSTKHLLHVLGRAQLSRGAIAPSGEYLHHVDALHALASAQSELNLQHSLLGLRGWAGPALASSNLALHLMLEVLHHVAVDLGQIWKHHHRPVCTSSVSVHHNYRLQLDAVMCGTLTASAGVWTGFVPPQRLHG